MTACEKREYVAFDRYVEKQPLTSDQRRGRGGAGARGGEEGGGGVGAGSEACNRVYMIGPVKKFGLVRLSTNFSFKTNMAEKADTEGR